MYVGVGIFIFREISYKQEGLDEVDQLRDFMEVFQRGEVGDYKMNWVVQFGGRRFRKFKVISGRIFNYEFEFRVNVLEFVDLRSIKILGYIIMFFM